MEVVNSQLLQSLVYLRLKTKINMLYEKSFSETLEKQMFENDFFKLNSCNTESICY